MENNVIGLLNDDELDTILAIGKNQQSGRITNFEIKALVQAYKKLREIYKTDTRAVESLKAIDRIIGDNIKENGSNLNRMNINGEWFEGPVVDATFSILKGLQKIAQTGVESE